MSEEKLEPTATEEVATEQPVAEAVVDGKEYTVEDIQSQIKPLSNNGFVRFFQKIWRWWLGKWYSFSDKHPKLSKILYMVFFFIVFSEGVTIWQFVVMTFLPYAFTALGTEPWGWPNIPLEAAGGQPYILFGDVQGLGYFIAFEIAVFTAQCINFPLQRNITYRSHGNPWYQAMWYFIGWVLVSVATNAVWGLANAFFVNWGWPDVVTGLIKTVLTGGVSMAIFFFIFLVIFPDNNKMAKKARAKYEKLKAANAAPEAIAKAEAKCNHWEKAAAKSNAEKEYSKAKSQASSKAIAYFAIVKAQEQAKEEEKAGYDEKVAKSYADAIEAIKAKEVAEEVYNKAFAA